MMSRFRVVYVVMMMMCRSTTTLGFVPSRTRTPATTTTTPLSRISFLSSDRRRISYRQKEKSQTRRSSSHVPVSFITPSDTWGNTAFLCGSATLAQILGKTTTIGRLLGPPVTAMAIVFGLASIGILNPGGTMASRSLQLLALNLATPLMLLGADLQDCIPLCGPLLPTFFMASFATIVGCIVGWKISGPGLMAALGNKDAIVIAAALLAKNIGGGINYIAVCQSLSASPPAVAAGLVVDNLFALIYFPATSILSSGLPDVVNATGTITTTTTTTTTTTNDPFPSSTTSSSVSSQNQVFQTCHLLFLSSTLLWLGEKLGGKSGALPCCTLLTLMVSFLMMTPTQRQQQHQGRFRWITTMKKRMEWSKELAETLGTTCLYLFFATAGAPGIAIADSVQTAFVPVSLYLSCLYGIHFLILWSFYQWFGGRGQNGTVSTILKPQRLLVASSAAIGGPATAIALAQANGWSSLILPSCIVGNVGYAIATFCGLFFAQFFRRP